MTIHLGTQSWNFKAWIGPFYPPGTPADDMLRWYSKMFSTLEVDATFYAVPAEPVVLGWRERVPDGFTFSLKLPQRLTHVLRLDGGEDELTKFVSRARLLEDALGAILVQLPPDFVPTEVNRNALRRFAGRISSDARWAMEFRHPGWFDADTIEVLRSHNIAIALIDGRWVRRDVMFALADTATADFAYVRWMGADRTLKDYSRPQLDREAELDAWAKVVQALDQRVDTVFGYFNNQFQGHSPHSVRELQRRLGIDPIDPASVQPQADLFGHAPVTGGGR